MTRPKLDQLCVNTMRFPAADAVQRATSGHPGTPTGSGADGFRALRPASQLRSRRPESDLFLQFTAHHRQDLPRLRQAFSFPVLAGAQALGDLQALRSGRPRAVLIPPECVLPRA
ncbi:MAG: hypothetical protein IH962_06960 [Chloroflexi bacterium]|nr:hypothetical protein [Chloroflexota bacterium]